MTPKQTREHLQLTKTEISDILDVHYNTWGKWESGERRINAGADSALKILVWLYDNYLATFNELTKQSPERV